MSKEQDNKATVGRWFEGFWGKQFNPDIIDQLAAPLHVGWAWWSAAFAAGGDDWAATQLAGGKLTMTAARTQFAARKPIVPLMFRGVRMWHRADLRGLRFDGTGRPCLEEVFIFGVPVKSS